MDEQPDLPNPSVKKMIAAVAVGVAVIILVFFGVGYLLGRLFL